MATHPWLPWSLGVHINCQRYFILLLGSPCFGVVMCKYMSGHLVIDMCLHIHIRGLFFFPTSDRASKEVRNTREPDLRVV